MGLAVKRDRQSNGSDGDKERRCKKTQGLQRNRQRHNPCQHIEDKFARSHFAPPLCDLGDTRSMEQDESK